MINRSEIISHLMYYQLCAVEMPLARTAYQALRNGKVTNSYLLFNCVKCDLFGPMRPGMNAPKSSLDGANVWWIAKLYPHKQH